MIPAARDVRERAGRLLFGSRLINNVHRGVVAEILVASALSESGSWKHCSEDWNAWDFEHADGCRLEVKQSAAVQSWHQAVPTRCSFGIASAQGYWSGTTYIKEVGRKAAIYIFAHHWIEDRDEADHCNVEQWLFYVVLAKSLPADKKILTLTSLRSLATPVSWDLLAAEVTSARAAQME